ncbi:efflux RND transporter periplasmic adaptor subunit [bacterium]|nr:efflux RND transporter periplasmic adaptor subunit [bacterium]
MATSKKKKLIFFGIFLVVIVVIVIASLSRRKEGIKVQTSKVEQGTLISTVSGPAKIQPEVEVKISAKVSGQIIGLGVAEGDVVKKGDFLVQLDQEEYKAALEQSMSNTKFARAGYEKAYNEYERAKSLAADNLISTAELEIAKSTCEQSKSTVEQAEAQERQARDYLSKTTIRAPMDGVVTQLDKKQGEMAMGSQFTLDVIMVVADLSRMQAEADVDENDVIHVELGDSAKIMVDAFPDTSFKGIVTEIAHSGTTTGMGTQEEVTNFLVKVAMVEKPKYLRPGMSATVDVITESLTDALKVPIQCVTMRKPEEKKSEAPEATEAKETEAEKDSTETAQEKTGSEDKPPVKVVFRVKDGMAEQVEVTTGISSDTEWEIKSGLEEGWEVVSGPYRILSKQLKNGDVLTVDNSMKREMREDE